MCLPHTGILIPAGEPLPADASEISPMRRSRSGPTRSRCAHALRAGINEGKRFFFRSSGFLFRTPTISMRTRMKPMRAHIETECGIMANGRMRQRMSLTFSDEVRRYLENNVSNASQFIESLILAEKSKNEAVLVTDSPKTEPRAGIEPATSSLPRKRDTAMPPRRSCTPCRVRTTPCPFQGRVLPTEPQMHYNSE